MEFLKVSAKSNPNSVAAALAGTINEKGSVEIRAIGAGALNQAIKAVAIAERYAKQCGTEFVCIPSFINVGTEEEERTAIKLIVEPR